MKIFQKLIPIFVAGILLTSCADLTVDPIKEPKPPASDPIKEPKPPTK